MPFSQKIFPDLKNHLTFAVLKVNHKNEFPEDDRPTREGTLKLGALKRSQSCAESSLNLQCTQATRSET